MFDRDNIIEIVQAALADVLGIYETVVTSDSLLQDDLGLEDDDLEDLAAQLQSALNYQAPAAYAAGCVLPASATPQPPEHSRVT